jgi:hypothetical protein
MFFLIFFVGVICEPTGSTTGSGPGKPVLPVGFTGWFYRLVLPNAFTGWSYRMV